MSQAVSSLTEKPKRRANVTNEAIMEAWQRVSITTDADGNKTGTIQQVADNLGMAKVSLSQRVNKLRKDGLKLNDMPRAKGGGRKKSVDDLQAMLDRINERIAAETSVEADSDFNGNPEAVETVSAG